MSVMLGEWPGADDSAPTLPHRPEARLAAPPVVYAEDAAALFVGYLRAAERQVLAVDADVNVHLAPLLGVTADAASALSHPDNVLAVGRHLLGTNSLVGGVERFVATTPAGPGSRLVTLEAADPVLTRHAATLDERTHVMHVGTYEPKDIGAGCYHGHLAILENLLSHLEPGGNKVVDDVDAKYLRRELGAEPLAVLPAQLRALHLKLAEKDWVRNAYGDVTGQLGPVVV